MNSELSYDTSSCRSSTGVSFVAMVDTTIGCDDNGVVDVVLVVMVRRPCAALSDASCAASCACCVVYR